MKKQIRVTMQWNEAAQKWLMKAGKRFVFDFWDCGTMHGVFKGLNKDNPKEYLLIVESSED